MERGDAVWVALVLVGALLIVGAPPDPQYSVSVSGPLEPPDDEPVVAFENLTEEQQDIFLAARDGGYRSGEAPPVEEMYVAYEGDVYEMSAAAHEGPVLSLLLPPIGGLFVLAGCLVAAYRHWYRS